MTGMTNASVLPDPVTACEQRKLSNQSSSLSLAQQGDTHLDDDVLVLQEEGDGSGLNGGHLFKSHIAYDIGTASGMLSVTLYAGLSESTGENEAVLEAHIHGVSAGWMRDHGPAYDGAAASLSVAISSSSCYAVRAEWLIDREPAAESGIFSSSQLPTQTSALPVNTSMRAQSRFRTLVYARDPVATIVAVGMLCTLRTMPKRRQHDSPAQMCVRARRERWSGMYIR